MKTEKRFFLSVVGFSTIMFILSGCLKTDPGNSDGGVELKPGTLFLQNYPVSAQGIEPPDDADGYCVVLAGCMCDGATDFDSCVDSNLDALENVTDEQCLTMIEEYYSNCIDDFFNR